MAQISTLIKNDGEKKKKNNSEKYYLPICA